MTIIEPESAPTADPPWWQRGVIYQIYPRSFMDANGDGVANDRPLGLARNTMHGPGYVNLDWAARDPDLACLHDDPEFQRLIGSSA